MIHIKNPNIEKNKIIHPITVNGKDYSTFFEYTDDVEINPYSEGIISVFYSIAKYNNIGLTIDPSVEKPFKRSIMKINEKISKYKNVTSDNFINKVHKPITKKNGNKKILCPLTGGIDSIYAALQFKDIITHYFYIIGCDINYEKSYTKWIEYNINHIKDLNKKFLGNKPLILIKSNLVINITRILREQKINTEWTWLTNGFGLFSSVIHINNSSKIILPGPGAGFGKYLNMSKHVLYHDFGDIGSTSFLKMIQSDATRIDKVKYIHNYNEKILKHLRICINWGAVSKMNCLNCGKCIRTSLILNLLKIEKHNLIKMNKKEIIQNLDECKGDNPIFYCQLKELFKEFFE